MGQTEVLTELEDRAVAEEIFEEKQLTEKKVVFNAESGITHEVIIDYHDTVPIEALWVAPGAGWRSPDGSLPGCQRHAQLLPHL